MTDTGAMAVADVLESVTSPSWDDGPVPDATVIVSSHNRAQFLDGLVDALAAQQDVNFDAIIVDNGSSDDTWRVLTGLCQSGSMRLRVIRLEMHNSPAVPRNTAVTLARGPIVAFTDDDCLPTPEWLSHLMTGFDDNTLIVQGRTSPVPGEWAGPWSRSLDVMGPTGLYETANLAVRREAVVAAGGFPRERMLSGRPFGEDVVLGAAVARLGGFTFVWEALNHHRVLPGTYKQFVTERLRLEGFPDLLRQVPELRRLRFAGVFLGRRRAITDLGLAAMVTAAALQSPWPLLGVLPWGATAWREAHAYPGRPRPVRAIQLGIADAVGFAALVKGSIRSRRVLL